MPGGAAASRRTFDEISRLETDSLKLDLRELPPIQ
jgi:hypothetical protein